MTALSANTRDKISERIDASAEALVADLTEIARIPSVVGNEATVQDRMERLYAEAGLGLRIVSVAPEPSRLKLHPAFIDTGASYAGRRNVVAVWDGDGSNAGRSIVLNGHIDVVEPGDPAGWSVDPWGATVADGWMYGRGVADMKAGVIANLYALKALHGLGLRPGGTITLQSVIDEEAGGAGGTLACLDQGYGGEAMISTEPEGLNLTVAHAGVCYFRVRVTGRAAHAALAHRGVNAIEKMGRIIDALVALDRTRGAEVHHRLIDHEGRSCHLNVGTYFAGEWPSSVPAQATIQCRIGFVPGESLAVIRRLVAETVAAAARADDWLAAHPPEIEWYGWQADPWEQDADHAFIRLVGEEAETVMGRAPRLQGGSGGMDARFASHYGMAAVAIGPIGENIHGADERVDLASVVTTAKIVANSVAAWTGMQR